MAESSYMIAPGETSDSLAMRKKLAMALAQKNMEPPKIEHWAQGLAHLADQAYSGYEIGKINRDEKEENAKGNALLAQLFNGGQAPQATPDPSMRPAGVSTPMGDTKVYSKDELSPLDAEATNQPRGYRNNNPLNIEAGGFTQGQPGFVGSDGRFAKFASLDQGVGAANTLLDTYEKKHGLNTIAGILSRWAPTSDGNNVSAYAANVSKQLGIDPNTPVPPEMRQKLIAAMAQHENGKPMPSMGAPQGQQMAQAAPQAPGGVNKEALIQMLGNRKTAPMARAIMQGAIAKQFEPTKPTDDMREYETAKQQGFRGSLMDYQIKLKEAGKPVTNINQQQESEYNKAIGKQFAEQNGEIMKGAQQARGKIATLDRLDSLLSDPNIYTGAGANLVLDAKKAAKAMGIDVGDLGGAEAVRAIGNQFALELRNPSGGAGMPGALSDKDREFLQASVPSLQQTPEGNKRIVQFMKKVAQRSVEVDRLRRDYVKRTGRLDEDFYNELAAYSDKNPLFNEADAAPAAPAASAPDKSALEAEMRRRGLLK